MRALLDANVLFAASQPGSATGRLVRLLIKKGTAVTCEYAHEEAQRNVDLKSPQWFGDLAALVLSVEIVPTAQFALPVELSETDAPVLCSAIRAGCDFLVSGDRRDFGDLYGRTVNGVTGISLLELAEMLTGSAE